MGARLTKAVGIHWLSIICDSILYCQHSNRFNVCVIPSFTSSILIKIESRTFKIFSLKCLPKKQFKHVLWDTEMAKERRGEGGNETTDILVV